MRSGIDAPVPWNLHVEQDATGLTLIHRWLSPTYIFFAFFSVIWDGFAIAWYTVVIPRIPSPDPLALWLPLFHVGFGILATYTALAGLLNRTVLRVSMGTLSIRHAPVPWPGRRDLLVHDIRQLYRQRFVASMHGGVTYRFRLNAVLRDGRKLRLLTVENAALALVLEERIERHLGMEDAPVSGEMPK